MHPCNILRIRPGFLPVLMIWCCCLRVGTRDDHGPNLVHVLHEERFRIRDVVSGEAIARQNLWYFGGGGVGKTER